MATIKPRSDIENIILGTVAKVCDHARLKAKDIDAQASFDPNLWQEIKSTRLAALMIPEELGGAAGSVALYCDVVETLSTRSRSSGGGSAVAAKASAVATSRNPRTSLAHEAQRLM